MLPGPGWNTAFFYNLVEASQQVGERPTAAFPSSHVEFHPDDYVLACQQKLFGFLLPFYVLLCGATVYIQAHYLIDSIAGFVSAFMLYILVTKMFKKWFAVPMFKYQPAIAPEPQITIDVKPHNLYSILHKNIGYGTSIHRLLAYFGGFYRFKDLEKFFYRFGA